MIRDKIILVLLASMCALQACNKEKRYSNKLMKGENWSVKHVKINGEHLDFNGNWHVQSNVEIYDTVPTVEWRNDGMDAYFEWQFQNKGKTFQLNYVQLCNEVDGPMLDNLDYAVHDLTGLYDVVRHGRNKMEFYCTSTLGHQDKTVEIFIERVKK